MKFPKMIAVDVDGTLYNSQGQVTSAVRHQIQRARKLGIVVVVASGRPLSILPGTNEKLGGADWNIGGNGSAVRNVATGDILLDATMSYDVAAGIVSAMRRELPGVGFSLELTDSVVAEPGFCRRIPAGEHPIEIADVLAGLEPSAGVRKTILFHDDYDQAIDGLAALVAPFVDDSCEAQWWGLPIVEITRRGTDKRSALQVLADHLGFNADDVMAFGDGGNDVNMLSWAGTGVAMANASAEIRSSADAVAPSNDNDGVAAFLAPILDVIESQ